MGGEVEETKGLVHKEKLKGGANREGRLKNLIKEGAKSEKREHQ